MNNQPNTKSVSTNQDVDNDDFGCSGTTSESSLQIQINQPQHKGIDAPNTDVKYYDSKEVKVEKVLIK